MIRLNFGIKVFHFNLSLGHFCTDFNGRLWAAAEQSIDAYAPVSKRASLLFKEDRQPGIHEQSGHHSSCGKSLSTDDWH